MKRELQLAAWAAAGVLVSSVTARAAVIGTDAFNYANGPLAGQAGGAGWAAERNNEVDAPPSTTSDWGNGFGTTNVAGNALVTLGSGIRREYNGLTEGTGTNSNEREGAFRGTGTVFYAVDMTRQAGADWSGASSFDFGGERIFYGVPSGQAFFGIEESGVGRSMTTQTANPGQTYRLVAQLDFDTDALRLWIDPTAGEEGSPDATRAYTGTNWSTAVRLASGGSGATTWDNVIVATDWDDLGLVPEPSSLTMLGIGALGLLRRRR